MVVLLARRKVGATVLTCCEGPAVSAWRQPASLGFFQANVRAKVGRQVQDTGEKVSLRIAQEEGEATVSGKWPLCQESLFPLSILT